MSKAALYLALIAVPMAAFERLDAILGATTLAIAFGAVDLAAWLVGDRTEQHTEARNHA